MRRLIYDQTSQTKNIILNNALKLYFKLIPSNRLPQVPLSLSFPHLNSLNVLLSIQIFHDLPLLPQYSLMQQSLKTQLAGCDCEDECEVLLSQRMNELEPSIKIKSLLSLDNISSESIPLPDLPNTPLSPQRQKENFHEKSLKTSKNGLNKSKTKPSMMRRTSVGNRERLSLTEGVRIFQMSEGGEGRKAMMTEVRGTRLNEFTGRGIVVLPIGKKYEGEWVQGTLIGQARITFPNGDAYQGQVYNYEQHGWGSLDYANGEKYEGEFSGGDFHGEGVFYDQEGKVKYEGQWKRGKIVE